MSEPVWQVRRVASAGRIGMIILAAVLVIVLTMPWWADRATMRLTVEIAYYLALAQLWNLLAGFGGMVSIGQQMFVGVGGYALFVGVALLGLPPLYLIPAAGLIAALVALPSALILFRLTGAYFAVGSWVLAEVFLLGFSQIEALGGGSGLSLPIRAVRSIARSASERESIILLIAVGLCVLALLLTYGILRSNAGLALMANRDNPEGAEAVGVNVGRTKLAVFLMVAGVTGMIGALIFLTKLRISPSAGFHLIDWTANVIFIVVIGGVGRLEGPFIGVAVFFVLRALLADLGAWYLIILGVIAVAIMLVTPGGLWGFVADRFKLEVFPIHRRIKRLRS